MRACGSQVGSHSLYQLALFRSKFGAVKCRNLAQVDELVGSADVKLEMFYPRCDSRFGYHRLSILKSRKSGDYDFQILFVEVCTFGDIDDVRRADSVGIADDAQSQSKSAQSETLPPNIKRLIHHGQILARPAKQPEGTQGAVAYELGRCLQLDRDHCLVVASMDEQGGGDLCVGNDAFVIQKLSDVAAAKAIPINRSVYETTPDGEKRFVAKYPAVGTFRALGCRLPNGKPHPAAGTGVLFSCTSTYRAEDKTEDDKTKRMVEVIQLRWDGSQLQIVSHEIVSQLLGLELNGSTPLASCPQDSGMLFPFGTVTDGMVAYRFDWDGKAWTPTRHGKPFTKVHTELEMSLRQQGDTYYLQTRCRSVEGNLYRSKDGLEYEFAGHARFACGKSEGSQPGFGRLALCCLQLQSGLGAESARSGAVGAGSLRQAVSFSTTRTEFAAIKATANRSSTTRLLRTCFWKADGGTSFFIACAT